MKSLDSVFPIQDLTSVSLAGHGDRSLGIEVLENRWMIAKPSFLLPREHGGVRKIEGHRHLRLYLIDILSSWATRTGE